MQPWIGSTFFFIALAASVVIRVPHDKRSQAAGVAESRRDLRESLLLTGVAIGGLLLPLAHVATHFIEIPGLSAASYPLTPVAMGAGIGVCFLWLWLFYFAHADLGENWSVTLELRKEHRLVTSGVYSRLRHPMYTAIFLHGLAQTLLLANWIAGPAMLVAFTLLYAFRVGREERMMRDRFGAEYEEYARRTHRIIPGLL
ncbi:MAG: isoprenylcysteine carboxylmethyltransferase family protein [Planctomycetes bacterium]|nr:isoprenylcysteine carboxylmethyltransferase family protein [Planctomycetota bacterium]